MNKLIKTLFYDREVVEAIRIAKPSQGMLYVHLISGRITLKEYIAAQQSSNRN